MMNRIYYCDISSFVALKKRLAELGIKVLNVAIIVDDVLIYRNCVFNEYYTDTYTLSTGTIILHVDAEYELLPYIDIDGIEFTPAFASSNLFAKAIFPKINVGHVPEKFYLIKEAEKCLEGTFTTYLFEKCGEDVDKKDFEKALMAFCDSMQLAYEVSKQKYELQEAI